ncbi:hypothetical protein [Streptomyces sp. NPDC005930]|uniref:hypothetical protein n=1 Tax=Streptomyces sp. NPDC005930 TaxID=3364736 RepID=UPI0036D01C07
MTTSLSPFTPPFPPAPGGGPKPPPVQRTAAKAVPLRRPAPPGAAGAPLPVAPLTPPAAPASRPALPVGAATAPAPPAGDSAPTASGDASSLPVQRVFGRGSRAGRTTSALAASAAAAVADTLTRFRAPSSHSAPHAQGSQQGPGEPLPPYESAPSGNPPSYAASTGQPSSGADEELPGYTAIPAGGFDPRQLSDFQLDELVHRIIGRVTRLVRTELRMDRERIGRLRDPR